MRVLACAVVLLLLAGCASTATTDHSDGASGSKGAPRQGRPGENSGVGENGTDAPHKTITVFSGPMKVNGQGPVTFAVDVPVNTTHVAFTIQSNPGALESIVVDLEGCGTYDGSGAGEFGGVNYGATLCIGTAEPGHHTATVSGQLMVVDGTFTLTGWQPE